MGGRQGATATQGRLLWRTGDRRYLQCQPGLDAGGGASVLRLQIGIGVGVDVAEKVAAEAAQGDVCQVANDNEPTQVVLSGAKVAVDRVPEIGKAHGVLIRPLGNTVYVMPPYCTTPGQLQTIYAVVREGLEAAGR